MARIRSIWPSICQSEDMANIPAELERTFTRLWTHCDDEGRAVDNPRLIKAALYPLVDAQSWEVVDRELENLAQRGLIARYEVDGVRLLQVLAWGKYQKPQKPVPSKLAPLPEDYATPTRGVSEPDEMVTRLDFGNGNGNRNTEAVLASDKPTNQVWDAFSDLFGEPTNSKAEKRRGANVNPVIDSIATTTNQSRTEARTNPRSYDFVAERASAWPLHFDTATITEEALMKHWETLGRPPMRATNGQVKKLAREIQSRFRRQELKAMEL